MKLAGSACFSLDTLILEGSPEGKACSLPPLAPTVRASIDTVTTPVLPAFTNCTTQVLTIASVQLSEVANMHTKAFAFALLAAATAASASDVVQLKKDDFADFVKTNDIVLAECKFLLPPSPPISGR